MSNVCLRERKGKWKKQTEESTVLYTGFMCMFMQRDQPGCDFIFLFVCVIPEFEIEFGCCAWPLIGERHLYGNEFIYSNQAGIYVIVAWLAKVFFYCLLMSWLSSIHTFIFSTAILCLLCIRQALFVWIEFPLCNPTGEIKSTASGESIVILKKICCVLFEFFLSVQMTVTEDKL